MLVSFQQGLGLALHGIGQAFLASKYPSEGPQWTYNLPLLSTEALKVSQVLLALQIALVSFRRWRPLLLSITHFNILYFAALAAFWTKHYPTVHPITLVGLTLMALGALILGVGPPSQQGRHQPVLKQKSLSKPKTTTTTPIKSIVTPHNVHHEVITKQKSHNTLDTQTSGPFSIKTPTETTPRTSSIKVVLPEPEFSAPIVMPEPPTAAACAQVTLELGPKRHSSGLSHHPNRVAPAFQKDPYKINVNELLAPDNVDKNSNQVFAPGYFESGRPLITKKGKGSSSSSSSMEIVEQVDEEPYRLYYNHDDDE